MDLNNEELTNNTYWQKLQQKSSYLNFYKCNKYVLRLQNKSSDFDVFCFLKLLTLFVSLYKTIFTCKVHGTKHWTKCDICYYNDSAWHNYLKVQIILKINDNFLRRDRCKENAMPEEENQLCPFS